MHDHRLLIATNNAHKVEEFRRLLSGLPVDLVTPADLAIALDVVEDGATFTENAALKARAFSLASGLPALADDSGIEVDALGGRPGLLSARYGGPGLTDGDHVQLLLSEMQGVSDDQRTCRFRAAIVIVAPGAEETAAEGTCEGRVAYELRGANGFGYDPVFYLPAYGRTMAELASADKDAISHRGQAARAIAKMIAPSRSW